MENIMQLNESYEIKYEYSALSIGTLMFHLQWCTKYCYKMFRKPETAKLLEACIRCLVSRNGIKVIEFNVQSEYIYCIVFVKFSFSVLKVLQILKGSNAKLFLSRRKRLD